MSCEHTLMVKYRGMVAHIECDCGASVDEVLATTRAEGVAEGERRGLERAAEECHKEREEWEGEDPRASAACCANRIRALITSPTPPTGDPHDAELTALREKCARYEAALREIAESDGSGHIEILAVRRCARAALNPPDAKKTEEP